MKNNNEQFWAIVPAAGIGRRMQAATKEDVPKQYQQILGKTILEHTLERIDQLDFLAGTTVVLNEKDIWWKTLNVNLTNSLVTTTGGSERIDSVLNGLQAIASQAKEMDWILVHDAVRPCVSLEDIRRLVETLGTSETGGLLVTPVTETLKKLSEGSKVEKTVPREDYRLAATPQMFRYGLLRSALEKALNDNSVITDEANAMENAGHTIQCVQGRADNIKITHKEDILLAEFFLNRSSHD
jgi:2-C-methyl-D-erythritol 4-phosphate cytidylyltransferase